MYMGISTWKGTWALFIYLIDSGLSLTNLLQIPSQLGHANLSCILLCTALLIFFQTIFIMLALLKQAQCGLFSNWLLFHVTICRLAKIEENMKNMPKIIEEYRKRMRDLRAKRKEERKLSSTKSLEAKRLGIHPKDPRALAGMGQDSGSKSKAKFKKK